MSKARQNWMAQADKLFAAQIKTRDGSCRRCASSDFLQVAHIISRSYKAIRVDPRNALTLCRNHHVYFTHRPLEWADWVEDQFPGRMDWLRKKALGYGKVDWKSEVQRLKVGLDDA